MYWNKEMIIQNLGNLTESIFLHWIFYFISWYYIFMHMIFQMFSNWIWERQ